MMAEKQKKNIFSDRRSSVCLHCKDLEFVSESSSQICDCKSEEMNLFLTLHLVFNNKSDY